MTPFRYTPAKTTALAVLIFALVAGCDSNDEPLVADQATAHPPTQPDEPPAEDDQMNHDDATEEERPSFGRQQERDAMVEDQVVDRGFDNLDVLDALRAVPRHRFVPHEHAPMAHSDSPLPIGHDQTISQPYIVALMTDYLGLEPGDKVLEIGTGSGYQAAVLAELGMEVYSIELICELAERADAALSDAHYDSVTVKCGDGYEGWEEHAPFDGIMVTAAPPEIPQTLKEQLVDDGGRLVAPVGDTGQRQKMTLIVRDGDDFIERDLLDVRFVPMVPGHQDD